MNLRRTRTGSTLRVAGILVLATGAVLAALAPSVSAFGSQVSTSVGSVEMAAGAALQAPGGWLLPAVFTVMVFAVVVAATMALTRTPAPLMQVPARAKSNDRNAPIAFELREPERAMTVRLDRLPGAAD